MPPASFNAKLRGGDRPPTPLKLPMRRGSIAILTPFSLDLYLPALPAIAADLKASPRFALGLAGVASVLAVALHRLLKYKSSMTRSIRDVLLAPSLLVARLFNPLQPLFGLAARLYVSSHFLLSGYSKAILWPSTLSLFENEFPVPYLTPQNAAVAGTVGELLVPSLLVLGFLSRLSALGLFVINALAVIAYRPGLLAAGAEGALGQRILWGTLLMFLVLYGPGKLSLDHLLLRARS